MASPSVDGLALGRDGSNDKKKRVPVAAIFIHAGAGYHSSQNEKLHLEACSEACQVAMKFLKVGGSATDAVEAAIKCLEDKEITNAGFGSNLNMDGIVEADATIVDYMGRSGACGAVPGVKNPISLAKLILDRSCEPLSMRRVPPNILVGVGARNFAQEHGMQTMMNDYLVSKNARDRYIRWRDDLARAEAARNRAPSPVCSYGDVVRGATRSESDRDLELIHPALRRDHTNAIMMGTWNEGQPDSPYHGGSPGLEKQSPSLAAVRSPDSGESGLKSLPGNIRSSERNPLNFLGALQAARSGSGSKRPKLSPAQPSDEAAKAATGSHVHQPHTFEASSHDSPVSVNYFPETNLPASEDVPGPDGAGTTTRVVFRIPEGVAADPWEYKYVQFMNGENVAEDVDEVSDTVGAIAIDLEGRIAAASSSGGIGMKHRGRIGPAALVGIGTAVIPEDPEDRDGKAVAAVTSGTGEHMATSMASYKCAERLYHNTRRAQGGGDCEEYDEDAIMESFVQHDFMDHPGVRNTTSASAIGVMAVKKTRRGFYFYFAHNTDSFALASLASNQREPLCVMSRISEAGSIARGGLKISAD